MNDAEATIVSVQDRPTLGAKRQFSTAPYKAVGAVGLSGLPEFFPEDLVPAYDPRNPEYDIHEPSRYTMEYEEGGVLVNVRDLASIQARGLLQPPLVAVLDGLPIVIEGSRRVYLCCEINRQRTARGENPLIIPVYFKTDADLAFMDEAHADGNEGKVSDDLMARARKMKRLYDGRPDANPSVPPKTTDEIALKFGMTRGTIEAILHPKKGLLALSPKAQAAVTAGKLAQSAAYQVASVGDHAMQDEMLAVMLKADADGKTPDRDLARTLANAVKKQGKDALQTTPDGKPVVQRDFRPQAKQLSLAKDKLRNVREDDEQAPASVAYAILDYLTAPNLEAIEHLPRAVQEALLQAVPLPKK